MFCKQILRGNKTRNTFKSFPTGINHSADRPWAGRLLIWARCHVYAGYIFKCPCEDSIIISHIAHINWVSSCKELDLRCYLATISHAYRKMHTGTFFPGNYITRSATFRNILMLVNRTEWSTQMILYNKCINLLVTQGSTDVQHTEQTLKGDFLTQELKVSFNENSMNNKEESHTFNPNTIQYKHIRPSSSPERFCPLVRH